VFLPADRIHLDPGQPSKDSLASSQVRLCKLREAECRGVI